MRVGGQCHAPAALPLGKTWYPLYRRLGGPQSWSGRVQKISPPPGFHSRTVQPVVSRYTDYAIPSLYSHKYKVFPGCYTTNFFMFVIAFNLNLASHGMCKNEIIFVPSSLICFHGLPQQLHDTINSCLIGTYELQQSALIYLFRVSISIYFQIVLKP